MSRLTSLLLAVLLPSAATAVRATEPLLVVELFTSQGCSSCPPADRVLSQLGEAAFEGFEVLPLAFHVDYWNFIGWTDPFSSAAWSRRQERYRRALDNRSNYTPQAVVNGRWETNGADGRKLLDYLERERRRAPLGEAAVSARRTADGTIEARVEATLFAEASEAARALVVVFDSDHTTPVRSGENAREELANDHVVRALEPSIQLDPGQSSTATVRLPFDRSWNLDTLGVAVLLQGRKSLAIFAAGRCDELESP